MKGDSKDMNNHSETQKVKTVIQEYIDGTFAADVDKLKNVFHENAVMNGFLGDNILIATPDAFIKDIKENSSMKSQKAPYHAEIEYITIEGNIATVIVSESGFRGSEKLVNHFHLIKINDEWQIISKLFTTI